MKNKILKFVDASFLLTFLTVSAAIASYFIGREDSKQKDRIEKVITKVDSLTRENQKLISKVNNLSAENNAITSRIDTVVNNTKGLAEQNIQITEKASELIANVGKIENQSKSILERVDKKTDDEFAVTGTFVLKLSKSISDIGGLNFIVGGNVFNYLPKELTSGISISQVFKTLSKLDNGFENIIFRVSEDSVYLSGVIYDYDKNVIAEINENKWRINKALIYKFNYDDRGIELYNHQGQVVFSVDMMEKNQIQVQGIMYNHELNVVGVSTNMGLAILDLRKNDIISRIENVLKARKFRKLFEYTGNKWRRVRVYN